MNLLIPFAPVADPLANVFPTIEEVYQEFADALRAPFVIAGGAVRDELLGRVPKDFDLFLFGSYDRSRLLRYQQGPPQHGYKQWHLANVVWRGAPVQVVSDKGYRTVADLLDDFDWNICGFAFDGRQLHCRMDVADIGPGKMLHLVSDKTPESSLRRGLNFARRYSMKLDPIDIIHLREKAEAMAEWSGRRVAA